MLHPRHQAMAVHLREYANLVAWSRAGAHTKFCKKSSASDPDILQNMFSFESLVAVSTFPPSVCNHKTGRGMAWSLTRTTCIRTHGAVPGAGVIMDEFMCAMAGASSQEADVVPALLAQAPVAQAHKESRVQYLQRKDKEYRASKHRGKRKSSASHCGAESRDLPQSRGRKSGARAVHHAPCAMFSCVAGYGRHGGIRNSG